MARGDPDVGEKVLMIDTDKAKTHNVAGRGDEVVLYSDGLAGSKSTPEPTNEMALVDEDFGQRSAPKFFYNFSPKGPLSVPPKTTYRNRFYLPDWDFTNADQILLIQDYGGVLANACRVGDHRVDYRLNGHKVGTTVWSNTGYNRYPDRGGGETEGKFSPTGLHLWSDNFMRVDPAVLKPGEVNTLEYENRGDVSFQASYLYMNTFFPDSQNRGMYSEERTVATDVTIGPGERWKHTEYIPEPDKSVFQTNTLASAFTLYHGIGRPKNAEWGARAGEIIVRHRLNDNTIFKRGWPNTNFDPIWNFHAWTPPNPYFDGFDLGADNTIELVNDNDHFTVTIDKITVLLEYHYPSGREKIWSSQGVEV